MSSFIPDTPVAAADPAAAADDPAVAARRAAKAAKKAASKAAGRARAQVIAAERCAASGQPLSKAIRRRQGEAVPRSFGARNERRGRVFVKFLLDTFGEAALRERGGVLDVAGGHGEITARLAYCHHIASTLLDPKRADLEATLHEKVVAKLPAFWRQRATPEAVAAALASDGPSPMAQATRLFTWPLDDELRRLVDRSSVLVGMHADAATEPLVDAALRHGRGFAVVVSSSLRGIAAVARIVAVPCPPRPYPLTPPPSVVASSQTSSRSAASRTAAASGRTTTSSSTCRPRTRACNSRRSRSTAATCACTGCRRRRRHPRAAGRRRALGLPRPRPPQFERRFWRRTG